MSMSLFLIFFLNFTVAACVHIVLVCLYSSGFYLICWLWGCFQMNIFCLSYQKGIIFWLFYARTNTYYTGDAIFNVGTANDKSTSNVKSMVFRLWRESLTT